MIVKTSSSNRGGKRVIYHFGDCTFDTVRGELRRSGKEIHTTPQVLVVLSYLFEHRDRMVSRDELLEQCWHGSYVSDVTLTICMRRVRQAIGQSQTGLMLIVTLHRRGYRFVAEVTESPEPAPVPAEVGTALLPTLETRMPSAIEREDAVASAIEPLAYEVLGERVASSG